MVPIQTIAHLIDSTEQPKPDTGERSILSVSCDPSLLTTREMILRAAGYKVLSVLGVEGALAQAGSNHFDLVIIGHSIPIEDRRGILQRVRQFSKAPVLSLWKVGPEEVLDAADYQLEASEGPIALLDMVRKIFDGGDGLGLKTKKFDKRSVSP